jgi:diaminopimelate decarboxylase
MDRSDVTPGGQLIYDGVDLCSMAVEHPTPFYLLSERVLTANYEKFVAAFAGLSGFKPYFSVKTNYESGVLCTLRALGAGAEISGALDFEATRRAGFRPQDVVFDGPSKTEDDLRAAIEFGVHLINVECQSELQLIDRLARERRRVVKVGVRIDPVIKNPSYGKLISTYKQKFGFPVNESGPIFELAKHCRNVQVVGLHAHIGSQITAPALYATNLTVLMDLAASLKARGVTISEINLGGGFPARSMTQLRVSRRMRFARLLERLGKLETPVPDIQAYAAAIRTSYEDNCRRLGIKPVLTTEPGRSLVSNAGVVVGRVRVVKGSWVFTDVSINDVPENLFFSEFRLFYPSRMREPRTRTVHLSGPTLATNDVVMFDVEAPDLRPGDPIAIFDTGAYSISRSNQFTRPRSGVFYIGADGAVRPIRRRETVEDVMRMQVWDAVAPPVITGVDPHVPSAARSNHVDSLQLLAPAPPTAVLEQPFTCARRRAPLGSIASNSTLLRPSDKDSSDHDRDLT